MLIDGGKWISVDRPIYVENHSRNMCTVWPPSIWLGKLRWNQTTKTSINTRYKWNIQPRSERILTLKRWVSIQVIIKKNILNVFTMWSVFLLLCELLCYDSVWFDLNPIKLMNFYLLTFHASSVPHELEAFTCLQIDTKMETQRVLEYDGNESTREHFYWELGCYSTIHTQYELVGCF